MLEFGCGNWSSAPHLNLEKMLESDKARRELKAALADHGLGVGALNCSGNPVRPGEVGRQHERVTHDTIKLASLMGVDRVVMMSGCPGAPGDSHASESQGQRMALPGARRRQRQDVAGESRVCFTPASAFPLRTVLPSKAAGPAPVDSRPG